MEDNIWRNGYWYFFEANGRKFSAFGSVWSGKEKVFVDDEVVSECRNLIKFNSRHKFSVDGIDYELMYLVTSATKGEIECLLIEGDKIIGRETKAVTEGKAGKRFTMTSVIAGFVTGFIATFIAIHFL